MRYLFEQYELNTRFHTLHCAGIHVPVRPKVFQMLLYLLEHRDRVVSKDELAKELWPDTHPDDSVLENCIMDARRAVGDNGRAQRVIRTHRSYGYRFIAQAEIGDDVSAQPMAPVDKAPPPMKQDAPVDNRRWLTIMACRIRVTSVTAHLDPDAWDAIMHRVRARCAHIIGECDGYVAQYLSDGMIAYFGYPQIHEDDAQRAVRAGCKLVSALPALSYDAARTRQVEVSVRVGIHTGSVVLADVGHEGKFETLAVGAAAAIATDLQSCAAPDAVWISAVTASLVDGFFISQAVDNHILDEQSRPLIAYTVLHENAAESRFEASVAAGLTSFVGRQHQIGLLLEHWGQAVAGAGQVVLLTGEVGIGKSRLMYELCQQLETATSTLITCRGSPSHPHSAFYPVIQFMQHMLTWRRDDTAEDKLRKLEAVLKRAGFELSDMVPPLAALLSLPLPARYPPLFLTPTRQRQKTLDALLAWLLKATEQEPVVLVLEDLHWTDPSTLKLVSLLIEHAGAARLLLLLTCRPDFDPPWESRSYLTHLTLQRLSSPQVETMIDGLVGVQMLPQDLKLLLVTRADGVPLFVEELTQMVLESELLVGREGHYELVAPLPDFPVPDTLHGVLMSRLDKLGTAKWVAQLGAVLGGEFTYELLQSIVSADETALQSALAQLIRAELLYQQGLPPQAHYRFKHALIQQAAYQSLRQPEQQGYHRQIAQVIAERFPDIDATQPELVAHHYAEAALHAEASDYWRKAARQAVAHSANVEAIRHVGNGLQSLATLPTTQEFLLRELDLRNTLATALTVTKGFASPEVRSTYDRIRELSRQAGETPQLFSVLWGLWVFYISQAAFGEASEVARDYMRRVRCTTHAVSLADGYYMLGVTAFYLGDFTTARQELERGVAHNATLQCALDPPYGYVPEVFGLSRRALTLWWLGYPEQALQQSRDTLALSQRQLAPFSAALALAAAALVHLQRREGQAAQAQAEASLALAEQHGFAHWLAQGKILQGCALVEQGMVREGIVHLRQGITDFQAIGIRTGDSAYLVKLAEAYWLDGQIEEGLVALQQAQEALQNNNDRFYEAELHRINGELLLACGTNHQQEALAVFRQALCVARRQQAKSLELRAAMSLSRFLEQHGEREEGRQILAEVYEWFKEGFDTADLREAQEWLGVLSGSK